MTSRTDPIIAVTGATGHVGGLVARDLADRDRRPRLVVRDPSRAPDLPGATVVTAAYADRAAAVTAFAGVDVLFLVSGSESADRLAEHRNVVAAAAEAGVGHVVDTSFLGAAPDATFTLARDHWATEGFVRERGLGHTFLRDSLYLDFLPALAGGDGVIRGPAGDGAVGAVARADAARIVTEATGRPTRYHPETLEEAYRSRASYGAPGWQVDAWVSTSTAIARGELAAVTDAVQTLTGRRPTALADLLRDPSPT